MTLAPGVRLGPYEILAPLGAGGMGEVFRARDTRLARDVAVKVLPDHLAGDAKAPDVPVPVQLIVERCLSKEPRERYDSTVDLARELEAWRLRGSEGTTAPPGDSASRHGDRSRFRRAAVLGIAVAVVVGGSVVTWRGRTSSAPPAEASARPSLLALPCKVLGAPEAAFLTDAVPSTLSTMLAAVQGIDTRVPPTSFDVEKLGSDLARIAEIYKVENLVLSTVAAQGDRLVLNVQLVEALTRKVRWAKQYEGTKDRYNDLAQAAAEAVLQAVAPGTGAAATVPTPATTSAAELALRQGDYESRRWWSTADKVDFDRAFAAYQQALELDPKLALAAIGVADLHRLQYYNDSDAQQLGRAESWARRALGMDPRCGAAWAELSNLEVLRSRPDPARGLDYALKAIAFAPLYDTGHYAIGSWTNGPGALSVSAPAMLKSYEVAPIYAGSASNAAWHLTQLGKPEQALPLIERALRAEPDHVWAPIARSFALVRLGRLDEASKTLQRCEAAATARHMQGELWRCARLDLTAAQKDTATAEGLARKVVATALDERMDALTVANLANGACAPLARLGRTDDALKILLRCVEVGFVPAYDWLLVDPNIQRLRVDPRFAKVLAASRDGAAMVARVLGEARGRGELPKYLEEPLDGLTRLLKQPTG